MAEVKDKDFVEYIVKNIVSHPDDVKVERKVDEMGVLLTLHINQEDMGYVIGKQGQTAKSIRTLLKIVGAKNNARVNLKIHEHLEQIQNITEKIEKINQEVKQVIDSNSDAIRQAIDKRKEQGKEIIKNFGEDASFLLNQYQDGSERAEASKNLIRNEFSELLTRRMIELNIDMSNIDEIQKVGNDLKAGINIAKEGHRSSSYPDRLFSNREKEEFSKEEIEGKAKSRLQGLILTLASDGGKGQPVHNFAPYLIEKFYQDNKERHRSFCNRRGKSRRRY